MLISELKYKDISEYNDEILELLVDSYKNSFLQLSDNNIEKICKEKLLLLNEYLENRRAIVIGALIEKELVGFLWMYKHELFGEERMHINQIVVKKGFRGVGIGRVLMQKMENMTRDHNISTVDLLVSEINNDAVNLYNKLGFKTERRYMTKKL